MQVIIEGPVLDHAMRDKLTLQFSPEEIRAAV